MPDSNPRNRFAPVFTIIQTALATPFLILALSRSAHFRMLGISGQWPIALLILLHWFGAIVAVVVERRNPDRASAIAGVWIAPNVCIAYLALLLALALPE
jgi:hypothetical protein